MVVEAYKCWELNGFDMFEDKKRRNKSPLSSTHNSALLIPNNMGGLVLVPIACFMAAHGWQNTGVGGFFTAKIFVCICDVPVFFLFVLRRGWLGCMAQGFQVSLLAEEYHMPNRNWKAFLPFLKEQKHNRSIGENGLNMLGFDHLFLAVSLPLMR